VINALIERRGARTALVTTGPFAVVRNPFFAGVLLSAAGLALFLPNVTSLGSFALLLTAIELQVRFVEEPYLLGAHGASYREYAGRVGRFVPGVGRSARDVVGP
jgi:protein-S-isoprenylcysteine O-methyltransferase Ste14